MCCPPSRFRTEPAQSRLPASTSNSHTRKLHRRVSLAVGFNVPAPWTGRDAATQSGLYSKLKQLLRNSAPAPCACAGIAATPSSCLSETGLRRRTSRMSPSLGPQCDAPCGTGRLHSCACHANGGRATGSETRASHICQMAFVPAWPPQAPNQLFASHSTLFTTWRVLRPHSMMRVLVRVHFASSRRRGHDPLSLITGLN